MMQKMTEADVAEFLTTGAVLGDGQGQLVVAWGLRAREAQPPLDEPAFFAPDFFLAEPRPWLRFKQWAMLEASELRAVLEPQARAPGPIAWHEPEIGEFSEAFNAIQNQFRRGALRKAVPIARATAAFEPVAAERAYLLRQILSAPPGPYPYGFWTDAEGLIGLSPELLAAVEGAHLRSMALAGTAPEAEAEALLKDAKELKEHGFVVADLEEILEAWGEVTVDGPRPWRLGPLAHLRTDLTVALRKPVEIQQATLWLHPTPALGVAPRSFPWRWLKDLPGAGRRGRFGAPFGVRHVGGNGQSVVAIRNLEWHEGVLNLSSGCGLVLESHLDREWAELKLKRDSVRKAMGL